MQALSIGLPVVTLPASVLVGRMGLILYNMLEYYELVCDSSTEYINIVHNITHNPRTRAYHVEQIISKRHKLFDDKSAISDWRALINHMVTNHPKLSDSWNGLNMLIGSDNSMDENVNVRGAKENS